MLSPTHDQLECLEGFEKTAFQVTDLFNRHPLLKEAGNLYMQKIGANWVDLCTRRLRYVEGAEHLRNLRPDRGVVLVSNHRSFFDLYVHDSLAGFAKDETLPSDPRCIYVGGDEESRHARASQAEQAEHVA